MMQRHHVIGSLLALGLLTGCGADTASDYNDRGNAAYEQSQYGQALTQYKEAALLAPDRPEPFVNVGNTRYQLRDYLGAIEAPKDALANADPATQAIIFYNMGNAHFRLQEFDKAIEAYQETLRRTPDDLDAKYNLEFAQKMLEQQQQQQQQAGGQGQPQQPGDPNEEPQEGPGQQDPQQQPGGSGQQERPTAPPSSMTPEEAQRELDRLRRSESRRNEDLYDNYAVGGDPNGDEELNGRSDDGW